MKLPTHALLVTVFAVALLAVTSSGCQQSADQPSESEAGMSSATTTTPALPDTTGAAVWAYMKTAGYQTNWTLWPTKGKLYKGKEPHGMLLTTYLNDVALSALSSHSGTMPAGAIIVKENYKPDSSLAAITVMYKVPGYNPAHNDWFFTKHLPDGSLDKAPNGMSLQGRVPGCQSCHSAKKDNDYIYTGALGM